MTAARSSRPPTRRSRRRSRRSARSPTCRAARRGTVLGDEIVDRYLDTVAELAADGPRDLDIVYTPLHGVGGTSVRAGPRDRRLHPTPRGRRSRSIPTRTSRRSPFPNPEEPGAMDLAMALAESARRRHRGRQRPGRRPLRGRRARPARLADAPRRRGRRAARLSPARGAARRASTRPRSSRRRCSGGWPRRPASRTPRRSPASSGSAASTGLAFGYEEALGYCVDPEHVRDKDGVSALLLLCELAARPRPRAARSTTCSTTSPPSTGCTPPTRCRSG